MTNRSRFRSWFGTHNNWTKEDLAFFKENIKGLGCTHYVFGMEGRQPGKTPHLQFCVYFAQPKSFKQVNSAMPRAHLQVTKQIDKAIEYCKKEGKFEEWGTAPATQLKKGQLEKDRWAAAYELLKSGKFDEIEPRIQINHAGNLLKLEAKLINTCARPYRHDDRTFFWFVGPSGSGKSRMMRSMLGGEFDRMYIKNPESLKWMDGINTKHALLGIEDIAPKHGHDLSTHLKLWLDRYPFMVEIKGGSRMVNFAGGAITSNYLLEQVITGHDLGPLRRRVKEVWFGPLEECPPGMSLPKDLPSHYPFLQRMINEGEEATFCHDPPENPLVKGAPIQGTGGTQLPVETSAPQADHLRKNVVGAVRTFIPPQKQAIVVEDSEEEGESLGSEDSYDECSDSDEEDSIEYEDI